MNMWRPEDTMTVAQLIKELEKMPPDLPVVSEGCDCDGDVMSLVMKEDYNHEPYVLLSRDQQEQSAK